MKILALAVLFLSVPAFADQAPPRWSLPNQGRDCEFRAYFNPTPGACGQAAYQVWTCKEKAGAEENLAVYLLVGEIKSDVLNVCSPTFVVKQVVRQYEPFRKTPKPAP